MSKSTEINMPDLCDYLMEMALGFEKHYYEEYTKALQEALRVKEDSQERGGGIPF